jgi:hypothetical protein
MHAGIFGMWNSGNFAQRSPSCLIISMLFVVVGAGVVQSIVCMDWATEVQSLAEAKGFFL